MVTKLLKAAEPVDLDAFSADYLPAHIRERAREGDVIKLPSAVSASVAVDPLASASAPPIFEVHESMWLDYTK
eukprot:339944-Amphidinium_carterae.1